MTYLTFTRPDSRHAKVVKRVDSAWLLCFESTSRTGHQVTLITEGDALRKFRHYERKAGRVVYSSQPPVVTGVAQSSVDGR
jgi:hypothetical protein